MAAGGAWDSLFTLPYLADEAPAVLDKDTGGSLLAGFVISYLVMVVGWATFATATLRAKVAPRGAAITMLVGSIIAILPAPTPLRLLVLSIGAALVGRAALRAERECRRVTPDRLLRHVLGARRRRAPRAASARSSRRAPRRRGGPTCRR